MVFESITFQTIGGIPLIAYGGMVTLICLLITASLPKLGEKKIVKDHLKWHMRMAGLTVVLGILHAIFGVLAFI